MSQTGLKKVVGAIALMATAATLLAAGVLFGPEPLSTMLILPAGMVVALLTGMCLALVVAAARCAIRAVLDRRAPRHNSVSGSSPGRS